MNVSLGNLTRIELLFQFLKYILYIFLCYNAYLFFLEGQEASVHTFRDGLKLNDVILAYSAFIDTIAWILLLLVFELETFVLTDDKLNGPWKWPILAIKVFSYSFILYAAYGYSARLFMLLNNSAFQIDDVCTLIGSGYTYIVTLDEYMPITKDVCQQLNGNALLQVAGTEIISSEAALTDAQRLGWVDVINAADWLLIVAILEVDIYLQLKGNFQGSIMKFSNIVKPILYIVLLFNAIYWGVKGAFVDFWDAFLWLLAFIFIEMNFFEWQEETKEAIEANQTNVAN